MLLQSSSAIDACGEVANGIPPFLLPLHSMIPVGYARESAVVHFCSWLLERQGQTTTYRLWHDFRDEELSLFRYTVQDRHNIDDIQGDGVAAPSAWTLTLDVCYKVAPGTVEGLTD